MLKKTSSAQLEREIKKALADREIKEILAKNPALTEQLERDIQEMLARNPSLGGQSLRDEVGKARNFVQKHGGPVAGLDRLLAAPSLLVALKRLQSTDFDHIWAARNFVKERGGAKSTVRALDGLIQIIDKEYAHTHGYRGYP